MQPAAGYGGQRPLQEADQFQYVYVLRCGDNKFYTGCTQNLADRLDRHHQGQVPATAKRQPLTLLSYFAFTDKYSAFAFEKYLKSGSGRAFLRKRLV